MSENQTQANSNDMVYIYTDGSCLGNPGPGGWGAVMHYKGQSRELSGSEADTTNNRMELMAAIASLNELNRSCRVKLHTDSEYLRRGMDEWLAQWQGRQWRKSNGKPIKNEDLWKSLVEAAKRHEVEWKWIRGHSGHPENEKADRLAYAAALKLQDVDSLE